MLTVSNFQQLFIYDLGTLNLQYDPIEITGNFY